MIPTEHCTIWTLMVIKFESKSKHFKECFCRSMHTNVLFVLLFIRTSVFHLKWSLFKKQLRCFSSYQTLTKATIIYCAIHHEYKTRKRFTVLGKRFTVLGNSSMSTFVIKKITMRNK